PDGKLAATTSDDRSVRLWDAATGRQRACFTERSGWYDLVAFSRDSKFLAAAGGTRNGKLRELETGRERIIAHPGVQTLTFLPDSRTVLTVGSDAARLWDVATDTEGAPIFEGAIGSAVCSPDGRTLALGLPPPTGRTRAFSTTWLAAT